jgi:hypothetical protein
MNPMAEHETEDMLSTPPNPDEQGGEGQYQITLRAIDGDQVIATANEVNGLADQARYWLNGTDAGAKMRDGDVKEVVLQKLDPATGQYADVTSLPVEDKQDVVKQIAKLDMSPEDPEEKMAEMQKMVEDKSAQMMQ